MASRGQRILSSNAVRNAVDALCFPLMVIEHHVQSLDVLPPSALFQSVSTVWTEVTSNAGLISPVPARPGGSETFQCRKLFRNLLCTDLKQCSIKEADMYYARTSYVVHIAP